MGEGKGEKIIATHVSDKELLSRIHKEYLLLDNKKKNSPITKLAKNLNRNFCKEDKQTISTREDLITIHERNQHKDTDMYRFTSTTVTKRKNTQKNHCLGGPREIFRNTHTCNVK